MTRYCALLMLALLLLFAVNAPAADWHVCKATGNNSNPGTAASPLKNLDAALAKAKAGDIVCVAGGVYYGMRDRGYIEVPVPVTLLGGYSPDFTTRDPIANPTLIQPTNESAGTSRNALMTLKSSQAGQRFVVDGFIFDAGQRNAYSEKDGWPEGVETGRLLLPTDNIPPGFKPTVAKPGLFIENPASAGDVLLQNNTFVNCAMYAVQGGHKAGSFIIRNNVFVANRMAAIEIFGTGGKTGPKGPTAYDGTVEVAYNTILFPWSRTKELEDMGYGVRVMTKLTYNIHHNILAGSLFAGVDHTRFNPNAWVSLDNNVFFANKQAPLLYAEAGNVQMERVKVADFGDLGLASATGNEQEFLKLPIDPAYLEGFLSAMYSEETDLAPDSLSNQLRGVFGLPLRGELTTQVTMYANRYSWQKAQALFGGAPDVGAQTMTLGPALP